MNQASTKKMTPGDDMHLTLLMAPHNLNLVTGQDRQHLLAFGRAAFEAGQKCQGCDVPKDGVYQISEPSHSMSQYASKDDMLKAVMAENEQLRAQLAAAQQGVLPEGERSATYGMNIAQRILHVGGRENAQTYIEFGSVEAVRVLVGQVLRDLPNGCPDFLATNTTTQGMDAQKWLQQHDMEALERFAETTGDCEGYDISKDAVRRLAGFGCLQYHGFGKYSITDFGHYVLADWEKARELPFKTQHERDAEFFEAIANQAKSATQAAKQGGV